MSDKDDIEEFIEAVALDDDEMNDLLANDVAPMELAEVEETATEIIEVLNQHGKTDLRVDYDVARENIHRLLQTGDKAMQQLVGYIQSGNVSPRIVEVFADLVRTMAATNKDLVGLHKSVKDIEEKHDSGSQKAGTINNIMFKGTTEELFDLLESVDDKKKEE